MPALRALRSLLFLGLKKTRTREIEQTPSNRRVIYSCGSSPAGEAAPPGEALLASGSSCSFWRGSGKKCDRGFFGWVGEQGMGLVWVLAWPEGWSSLQGCAHPGPSLAALGDLARASRCNPGQSTARGRGVAQVSPSSGGRVAGATGEVAPAVPGPAGGSAPGCPAKIPVAVGCVATGAAAIPIPGHLGCRASLRVFLQRLHSCRGRIKGWS